MPVERQHGGGLPRPLFPRSGQQRAVWELASQRLEVYRGNYSAYVVQRTERRERQRKEWQRQQQVIAKEEDFIRRNIAGQNTNRPRAGAPGWSA